MRIEDEREDHKTTEEYIIDGCITEENEFTTNEDCLLASPYRSQFRQLHESQIHNN
jgi:hypothetical protein